MDNLNSRLEAKIDKLQIDMFELNKAVAELRTINLRHDELSRENAIKIEVLEREMHEQQGAIRFGKWVVALLLTMMGGLFTWVVNYETGKADFSQSLKDSISENKHVNDMQDDHLKRLTEDLNVVKRGEANER